MAGGTRGPDDGQRNSFDQGQSMLEKGDFLMPVDQRDAWVRAYLEDVFNGHNLHDRYNLFRQLGAH
jgi:hypothetical protein